MVIICPERRSQIHDIRPLNTLPVGDVMDVVKTEANRDRLKCDEWREKHVKSAFEPVSYGK